MKVALNDNNRTNFPNLALMKLAAHHKAKGDDVEWYMPLRSRFYDRVYTSKVFTFTPTDSLWGNVIKGGTGYNLFNTLPEKIEHTCPDYSLYPEFKKALGFLTRGCPNKCKWCVVPKKEGNIKPNADIEEFLNNRKSAVLMDNNVLASEHGLKQIEKIINLKIKVDFNQGLDARIIAENKQIARLLSKTKWINFIRMACDHKEQMSNVEKALQNLNEFGVKNYRIFIYMLVTDLDDALERALFLRKLNTVPFAQPYRDLENNVPPSTEQRRFARWVNHKAIFKTVDWNEYV